jgi:hypothetical protein
MMHCSENPDADQHTFRSPANEKHGRTQQELAKTWEIFSIGLPDPITLRAIPPKGENLPTLNKTFTAREYPELDARKQAFTDAAINLNMVGYNIYTSVNPVLPTFEGNRVNGMAVKDKDIACRRRLLIDIDRVDSSIGPATDEELAEAKAVADRIAAYLDEEHDIQVCMVMSGNGYHLYVPLADLANDDKSKLCCQWILQGLARRFNTDTIKVDTSVFNASRITKVPGTIARKGLETQDRPYRMAKVIS